MRESDAGRDREDGWSEREGMEEGGRLDGIDWMVARTVREDDWTEYSQGQWGSGMKKAGEEARRERMERRGGEGRREGGREGKRERERE